MRSCLTSSCCGKSWAEVELGWYQCRHMRFLGIGSGCDLGDMYLQLAAAGHEVRVFSEDFAEHGVMGAMLTQVDAWRPELDWVRAAGSEGVILFEGTELGEEKDQLRRDGFAVIGGCAF